jgi:hypothetical protein
VARYYNSKVKKRSFRKGDLVFRKAEFSEQDRRLGKLAANWEGPYKVKVVLGSGAYILETLGGKKFPTRGIFSTFRFIINSSV